jgi:hypothetical protein
MKECFQVWKSYILLTYRAYQGGLEETSLAKTRLGLMSFGIFLIIVAVWIALWALRIIAAADTVPLILLSSGIWTIVVAGIRAFKPEENGRAFSNFGWGMLFIVLGGSLYMINNGMDPMYTVVFILALLGTLAVVTALRSSRR